MADDTNNKLRKRVHEPPTLVKHDATGRLRIVLGCALGEKDCAPYVMYQHVNNRQMFILAKKEFLETHTEVEDGRRLHQ